MGVLTQVDLSITMLFGWRRYTNLASKVAFGMM